MPMFTFSPANLIRPAHEVTEYVEHLIAQLTERGLYYRGPDRRAEERHRIAIPVMVMPIDRHLQPMGEGFAATTRDISNGGILLVHSANVPRECRFLAVELYDMDQRFLQAAVEILRRGPCGPFQEIAGRFVTKVRRRNPFSSLN